MSVILPSTTKMGYIVICGKDFYNIIYKLFNLISEKQNLLNNQFKAPSILKDLNLAKNI